MNRPLVPAQTSAEQIADINRQAQAIADELANKHTHPRLWGVYENTVRTALLRLAAGIEKPSTGIHDERD